MNHDRESDGELQQRRRVCELVDSLVTGALKEGIEPAALARYLHEAVREEVYVLCGDPEVPDISTLDFLFD